jgi:hypothetical protein
MSGRRAAGRCIHILRRHQRDLRRARRDGTGIRSSAWHGSDDFTGKTVKVGSGYQIIWNAQKLAALPPAIHDLLFFHECAHAKVPTTDEVQANCVGLKDMRATGRAGLAVEARLAAFYGATNGYWLNTLRCANAEPKAAGAAGSPPP